MCYRPRGADPHRCLATGLLAGIVLRPASHQFPGLAATGRTHEQHRPADNHTRPLPSRCGMNFGPGHRSHLIGSVPSDRVQYAGPAPTAPWGHQRRLQRHPGFRVPSTVVGPLVVRSSTQPAEHDGSCGKSTNHSRIAGTRHTVGCLGWCELSPRAHEASGLSRERSSDCRCIIDCLSTR